MDNMGRNETYERLNKEHEKEILRVARNSLELKQAGLFRPARYCRFLVRFGELLVSLGTHLKIHYSPRLTR